MIQNSSVMKFGSPAQFCSATSSIIGAFQDFNGSFKAREEENLRTITSGAKEAIPTPVFLTLLSHEK